MDGEDNLGEYQLFKLPNQPSPKWRFVYRNCQDNSIPQHLNGAKVNFKLSLTLDKIRLSKRRQMYRVAGAVHHFPPIDVEVKKRS